MLDQADYLLLEAVEFFATKADRAAIDAWRQKSDATRAHCIAYMKNNEDKWTYNEDDGRPSRKPNATPPLYDPDGRRSEYAPGVKPVYLAAHAALTDCGKRLQAALSANFWELTYQPSDRNADRIAEKPSTWRFFEVLIDVRRTDANPYKRLTLTERIRVHAHFFGRDLDALIGRIDGYKTIKLPPWLRSDGAFRAHVRFRPVRQGEVRTTDNEEAGSQAGAAPMPKERTPVEIEDGLVSELFDQLERGAKAHAVARANAHRMPGKATFESKTTRLAKRLRSELRKRDGLDALDGERPK